MYKIEKFLLDHKFKKKREWESGVIVYSDIEEEREYNTEVALYTRKDPKIWEITIFNPFAVCLGSYRTDYDKDNFIKTHKCLAEDQVDYAFDTKEWLDELENPWEENN